MKKFILTSFIALSITGLSITHNAFSVESMEKCDHACTKCHQITKEDAQKLLQPNFPDLKVLEVRPSQIKGLLEVAVVAKGQKGVIYIDSAKKYLITGSILDASTKTNLTQERYAELTKVDVSKIPLDDALVLGDKDAKYRVIVFDDPECPYCGKLHQEMKKVVEKRQDIVFFIKMFPLKMHKGAYEKAKAIVCEKSLSLLEDAFAGKPMPTAKCETTALDANIKLTEELGIRGTPAIVLPNGAVISGFKEADVLISLIERS